MTRSLGMRATGVSNSLSIGDRRSAIGDRRSAIGDRRPATRQRPF
jgi:hypothetical protein